MAAFGIATKSIATGPNACDVVPPYISPFKYTLPPFTARVSKSAKLLPAELAGIAKPDQLPPGFEVLETATRNESDVPPGAIPSVLANHLLEDGSYRMRGSVAKYEPEEPNTLSKVADPSALAQNTPGVSLSNLRNSMEISPNNSGPAPSLTHSVCTDYALNYRRSQRLGKAWGDF
jgi:hypothetical protein